MQSAPGICLFSQSRDQFQQTVDDGLVEQIDEQGLPAAPAEEACDRAFPERAGQACFFVRVDCPAEDGPEHVPAEVRQKREIIAGREAVKADEIFTVLMGENVEPRKEWIEANAKYVVNLDI